MDLAAGIEKIAELTRAASAVHVVPLTAEPTGEYLIVDASGQYIRCIPDPPPRRLAFDHPRHLVDFVMAEEKAGTMWDLFLSRDGLVGWDFDSRRQRATCKFEHATTWNAIRKGPSTLYSQSAFVALLNSDLAGCHPGKDFIAKFRSLDWELVKSTKGRVGAVKNQETMSSEVKRACYGEVPDTVDLLTRVFTAFARDYIVRCSIVLAHDRCEIMMVPLPNELPDILDRAVADLADELRAQLEGSSVALHLARPAKVGE